MRLYYIGVWYHVNYVTMSLSMNIMGTSLVPKSRKALPFNFWVTSHANPNNRHQNICYINAAFAAQFAVLFAGSEKQI